MALYQITNPSNAAMAAIGPTKKRPLEVTFEANDDRDAKRKFAELSTRFGHTGKVVSCTATTGLAIFLSVADTYILSRIVPSKPPGSLVQLRMIAYLKPPTK